MSLSLSLSVSIPLPLRCCLPPSLPERALNHSTKQLSTLLAGCFRSLARPQARNFAVFHAWTSLWENVGSQTQMFFFFLTLMLNFVQPDMFSNSDLDFFEPKHFSNFDFDSFGIKRFVFNNLILICFQVFLFISNFCLEPFFSNPHFGHLLPSNLFSNRNSKA